MLLIDKIFRAKNRREVPHPQSFRHCPGTKSFNIGIQSWQYIKVNILERKCQGIDFNPWPEAKQIKSILGQANLSSVLLHDNFFVQGLFHGTDKILQT